jgi:hypothetical protein
MADTVLVQGMRWGQAAQQRRTRQEAHAGSFVLKCWLLQGQALIHHMHAPAQISHTGRSTGRFTHIASGKRTARHDKARQRQRQGKARRARVCQAAQHRRQWQCGM